MIYATIRIILFAKTDKTRQKSVHLVEYVIIIRYRYSYPQ